MFLDVSCLVTFSTVTRLLYSQAMAGGKSLGV